MMRGVRDISLHIVLGHDTEVVIGDWNLGAILVVDYLLHLLVQVVSLLRIECASSLQDQIVDLRVCIVVVGFGAEESFSM
jgi:hypothetical protein